MPNKIIGYYQSWAQYREGNGKFTVNHIDPSLFTHLNYAFFGLNINGEITIKDPYLDLSENNGLGNIRKFNSLKQTNSELKTLASIGGHNEGSAIFSQIAADPIKRRNFAINARDFCKNHGFDGIDIDWEFPGQGAGSSVNDKINFILMLQEVYQELKSRRYILSAAVSASCTSSATSYDFPNLFNSVDFINIMTYDYHGPWENTVGHNAPMYRGPTDVTEVQKTHNVCATIEYWLSKGAPRNKINLGIPFYGRTCTLRDISETSPGAYNRGPGICGHYTKEAGFIGYNEICEIQGTIHWDNVQQVPYKILGDQWITYDNVQSIEIKSKFAEDQCLGGVMVWAIDTDDFLGLDRQGKNPLIKKVNSILR